MIQNQFGVKIRRFRSDNAKDYFNQTLFSYFQNEGIIHESSCVHTPQQNGVAERKNGHLLATTRAFLFHYNTPKSYWGEALLTATYLINRLPSTALGLKSPMETLSSFYPEFRTHHNIAPKVFGCTAYVHIHSHERGKLDPRALKCIFVGYSATQKGYKCYHPPTRKTFVSIDVTFDEKNSYFSYPINNSISFNNFSSSHQNFLVSLEDIRIPKDVFEALSDKNWRNAMKDEMQALEKNETWEIVNLPIGKKSVGCKWVFSVKYKADGTLERYKARLVAKGFTQTYGIDYQETFAPVAKMNTVRILLSLAAKYNWHLEQLDVKNAFLHGDLEEEIFMEIPPGFKGKSEGNKVCKLKKALYGLKQSPRAWFGKFSKFMLLNGYQQSQGDHTLFFKHSDSGGVTILLVYVDDIILTGSNEEEKASLRKNLAKEFDIKELGRLKYFLGIEVAHSSKGIFISQQKYIKDLLKETGKLACKPAPTPVEPNLKLGEAKEDPDVDKGAYQRLVGKLIYLSHTRPDIAFAVSMVSQFMQNPKQIHMQAVDRILHYLKGRPGKGILFKRDRGMILEVYTDADYAGSLVDRRSTFGYCTFLGGNLVIWRSKKQNVVARSSAEAEYRAMALGICELLWIKIILEDLKVKWDEPMKLNCDNKSTISIATIQSSMTGPST
ncbi:Retrovirus-related Pol polyprotein from transposon TNT 1-94 [Dendrobium catenatum]|uniref:Retrovirus-related Pol polyprotein from transposon TNT 1-94 n=1 Tax=Dendrobium catenatum TaxID=906689 RepID=A0A2I0WVG5_9ASPA|nr:Retrovirus-related Pol polyprotein from transposon TNT 1-94 [Dendrobium catenatum]